MKVRNEPLLLGLLAVFAPGCGKSLSATEVMVILDAEPGARASTETLEVLVRGGSGHIEDAAVYAHKFLKSKKTLKWPHLTALAPENGDATREYEFVATATNSNGDLVAQVRAMSGYVAHRQLALRLVLEDDCIGTSCADNRTCVGGKCVRTTVDPGHLLPFISADLGASGSGTKDAGAATAHTDGGRDGGSTTSAGDAALSVDGGPLAGRCGDGQVTGDETCDISIESGKPGSCPVECSALDACTPRALNNSGTCNAECVRLSLSCQDVDGCCPAGCTHANDSDCSATCGDGILQPGETCDPKLASAPCKTLADCDDQNACTLDMLTGSALACNADCMHTDITMLKNGDGCCPSGANANTDTDCKPVCGNGVHEAGEDCDGSSGCSSDCKLTLTSEQARCLTEYGGDPCASCSCMNCVGTNQYLDCRDIDKTNGNDKCNAVLVCERTNNCTGQPCYCGGDATCGLFTGGPAGPCTAQIEAAAGAAPGDTNAVTAARNQAGSVLNRAFVADQCRVMNCKDTCR